ncbi:hypothetical protein [Ornithinibacillus halotolerans]|uniref:Uncharacterized protein n=1 Tax=Ornithinibacillus halotolerans TaxID=1274357 RepID=A0A916WA05_9BACI|nr:hypothetical protein [Ornithinibacillus halotolerans]GGA81259.1 hypothetical protein GCM10008025_25780 [Ornithinibacillus halotolerans]
MYMDFNRMVIENRLKEMRKYAAGSNGLKKEKKLRNMKKQQFHLYHTREVS